MCLAISWCYRVTGTPYNIVRPRLDLKKSAKKVKPRHSKQNKLSQNVILVSSRRRLKSKLKYLWGGQHSVCCVCFRLTSSHMACQNKPIHDDLGQACAPSVLCYLSFRIHNNALRIAVGNPAKTHIIHCANCLSRLLAFAVFGCLLTVCKHEEDNIIITHFAA